MYAKIGIGLSGDVKAEIMRHRRSGHRTLYYVHAVEQRKGNRYSHRGFGTRRYQVLDAAIREAREAGTSLRFTDADFMAAMDEAIAVAASKLKEI